MCAGGEDGAFSVEGLQGATDALTHPLSSNFICKGSSWGEWQLKHRKDVFSAKSKRRCEWRRGQLLIDVKPKDQGSSVTCFRSHSDFMLTVSLSSLVLAYPLPKGGLPRQSSATCYFCAIPLRLLINIFLAWVTESQFLLLAAKEPRLMLACSREGEQIGSEPRTPNA